MAARRRAGVRGSRAASAATREDKVLRAAVGIACEVILGLVGPPSGLRIKKPPTRHPWCRGRIFYQRLKTGRLKTGRLSTLPMSHSVCIPVPLRLTTGLLFHSFD